jgi:hypothetical protein
MCRREFPGRHTLRMGLLMMSRLSAALFLCVAISLLGCGDSHEPAMLSCPTPRQSKTWLLSEVDDSFKKHPDGAFQFPILNQAGQTLLVRVHSIGCSCYQLKRGETRLKVDDQFEIGSGATEMLTLFPPRPAFDRASDYNFSLAYERDPGAPTTIISCQGVLNSIADIRVNPTVLTAEFIHDSPSQRVLMEITRTARKREDVEHSPLTSGWPEGTQVAEPVSIGESVQVPDGLWKRTWRVSAVIPKPSLASNPQETWPIRVGGSEPESPHNQVQLMIRLRSGLSGPRIVHFGDLRVGLPTTRRIQILARDGHPFRILGPSDPNEILSLQSDSTDAVKTHWSNLTINARTPGEFRQTMQVETDHPQQPNLAIEVRANITASVSDPSSAAVRPGGE